jgi:hypothetical protein
MKLLKKGATEFDLCERNTCSLFLLNLFLMLEIAKYVYRIVRIDG